MKYYKFLTKDGKGPYSEVRWNLPTEDGPGEWMPEVEELERCKSGYHVCRAEDLPHWLCATLYEFEGRGRSERYNRKTVFTGGRLLRKLKWGKPEIVAFARGCAESAQQYAATVDAAAYVAAAASAADAAASAAAAYAAAAASATVDAAAYAAIAADAAASATVNAAASAAYAAERRRQSEHILQLSREVLS